MKQEILISICVPTYNRANVLQDCLESIVGSKAYDDNVVEIVVSDNNSTDETPTIVSNFVRKFNNVVYNRNEENIGGERNFIKVLSIAHGKLLKLHNDYCVFTENGIGDLLNIARNEDEKKSFIFLDSRQGFSFRRYECPNMNTFVQTECMYLSWISSFVFWNKDYMNLEEKDREIATQFMQTDWALRLYRQKEQHVIYFCDIFRRNPFKERRGGFNFINIFSKYPQMFIPYKESGDISEKTIMNISKQVFENLLLWYYRLNIKKDSKFTYETTDNLKTISTFRKRYQIGFMSYLLFAKVIIFESLPTTFQMKIRAYFLKRQQKRLVSMV